MENILQFVDALVILASSLGPLYLLARVRGSGLRTVSLLLALFTLTHGVYHTLGGFGLEFWADAVFEPLSVILLVFFGLYYAFKGGFL